MTNIILQWGDPRIDYIIDYGFDLQDEIDLPNSEKPSVNVLLKNMGIDLNGKEVTVENDEILSLLIVKYADQEY